FAGIRPACPGYRPESCDTKSAAIARRLARGTRGHVVADADSRASVVTAGSDEPTAQAQASMEGMLRLVRECRVVPQALEHPPTSGESSSVEAERILYFTLMSAIDAGLIKTM